MVRRALSHRRGSTLSFEIDTVAATAPPISPVPLTRNRSVVQREPLPLSRHHRLRRSSNASATSAVSSIDGSAPRLIGDLYEEDSGSAIIDDEAACASPQLLSQAASEDVARMVLNEKTPMVVASVQETAPGALGAAAATTTSARSQDRAAELPAGTQTPQPGPGTPTTKVAPALQNLNT